MSDDRVYAINRRSPRPERRDLLEVRGSVVDVLMNDSTRLRGYVIAPTNEAGLLVLQPIGVALHVDVHVDSIRTVHAFDSRPGSSIFVNVERMNQQKYARRNGR